MEYIVFYVIIADNRIMAKKQLTTSFQPDPAILAALKKQAEIQDRSVSWLVNYYVKKGMEVDGVALESKEKKPKV